MVADIFNRSSPLLPLLPPLVKMLPTALYNLSALYRNYLHCFIYIAHAKKNVETQAKKI